jgi:hypothetical protein
MDQGRNWCGGAVRTKYLQRFLLGPQMKYAYEDLYPQQFEQLIVLLCQHLLGMSVQPFATGPDGGRDAKFVGTAEIHPSRADPWKGIVIVQAKHTAGYYKSCSDSDFYSKGSTNTVIGEEIPRIKKLRHDKKLDHYILFTNRRLTGNTEEEIRTHISTECEIPYESIYLAGVEDLEKWWKTFPEVPVRADIDPIDSPLLVSPDELANVVEALARHRKQVGTIMADAPTPRIPYDKKNVLNNMSKEYAKAQLRKYLKETRQIEDFLSAPENTDLLELYNEVVDEFDLKIIAKRKDYQSFDEVMNYLLDLLFDRDVVLRQNKRLTRLMLFYMYWNCDIGVTDDAETI